MRVIDILIALQWDSNGDHYTHIWMPLQKDRGPEFTDLWFWLMRWEET